ncbi:hypothetical protein J6590_051410 [Homalodisca vitripennis]|nr:hypothetical protein J6590_051410 [Homalodisca vitripennis]
MLLATSTGLAAPNTSPPQFWAKVLEVVINSRSASAESTAHSTAGCNHEKKPARPGCMGNDVVKYSDPPVEVANCLGLSRQNRADNLAKRSGKLLLSAPASTPITFCVGV